MITITATISGDVQGVGFRASTQAKAQQLGLSGWVRNLPNGNVDMMATGKFEIIKALVDWLWQSPGNSRVTNVDWEETLLEKMSGFQIR